MDLYRCFATAVQRAVVAVVLSGAQLELFSLVTAHTTLRSRTSCDHSAASAQAWDRPGSIGHLVMLQGAE